MADRLVEEPAVLGLVSGVGMHLSKYAAVVLSTDPGRGGRPTDPDGTATDAVAVCDLTGDRFGTCYYYARSTDPGLLAAMEAEEWFGRRVQLVCAGAVNMIG